MFDTQVNGEEGSAALNALGVSATDVHGQIRPTEQVLLDLADKFSAMPDGADKAALAVKLFGKEGLAIIPFLNQGREGITALMEEAQRLGLVMSEDVARASEVFNDNLDPPVCDLRRRATPDRRRRHPGAGRLHRAGDPGAG
jgi:hypothetical protein